MSVYMIIDSKVKDSECYQRYISEVSETVTKHGGRYLARGSEISPIAGDWKPERIILLEFPSEENIREWLFSAEYEAIAPLREAGAETRAIVVQGCSGQDS